ncbi:MAG TPA: CoA-binding protein, partial [Hyphomonadaceae bacterium]|nr:CoA-binding protein [Hyphomonadaceae bacterium]
MTAADDAAIRDLLLTTRRIAVVGASDRPDRP